MIRQPPIVVCDEGEELCIQVELPGVKKDDLDVEIYGERIELVGRAPIEELSKGQVLFAERVPVEYRREIILSDPIVPDDADANLEDGVLTIRIPKQESGKGGQHIKIK